MEGQVLKCCLFAAIGPRQPAKSVKTVEEKIVSEGQLLKKVANAGFQDNIMRGLPAGGICLYFLLYNVCLHYVFSYLCVCMCLVCFFLSRAFEHEHQHRAAFLLSPTFRKSTCRLWQLKHEQKQNRLNHTKSYTSMDHCGSAWFWSMARLTPLRLVHSMHPSIVLSSWSSCHCLVSWRCFTFWPSQILRSP